MSSFRKIAKSAQKTYKERSQPTGRLNLGFLEKKKDYKLRSKDYHVKQDKLKKLRRKVLNKNPDEFYFKMVNSRLEDGVHKWLKNEEIVTPEQQMLMDTQDKKYVDYKLGIEAKKIEKLQSTLHMVDTVREAPQNRHIFFVDTKAEVDEFDFASRLGIAQSEPSSPTDEQNYQDALLHHEKEKKYHELAQREKREKELKIIAGKMESRTNQKDKNRKVLVKQETKSAPAVYKFFPVRKR